MNTALHQAPEAFPMDAQEWSSADESTQSQICGLLANFQPRGTRRERRLYQRYPFPYLIQLTPIGPDGEPVEDETVAVVGKHISERGLGFYHTKPLPYRRMIVSLETGTSRLRLLIELGWCRFTKQGWYESGGRFLQAVPSSLSTR
jgi:hypothetical protein